MERIQSSFAVVVDGGDFGSEGFRDLHRPRADATAGTDDQDAVPGLDAAFAVSPCQANTAECGTAAACSNESSAGLMTATFSRTQTNSAERAVAAAAQVGPHVVAGTELGDVGAD